MTERPILFRGEMVRAILDGRKTQTRRLVTLPKRRSLKGEGTEWVKSIHQDGGGNWVAWSTDAPDTAEFTKRAYPNGEGFPCPYGKPGDRLWVREAFASFSQRHLPDHDAVYPVHQHYAHYADAITIYRESGAAFPEHFKHLGIARWRPGVFMHRYESRLTLEITGVRVERLQEISARDSFAEGYDPHWQNPLSKYKTGYLNWFGYLWDDINGKRAPWASNPWVWVIEFKRIEAGEK